MGCRQLPATAARRPMLNLQIPLAWRWTPPATCSSRILITTASARWEPTGLSPRWRATGLTGYSGDGGAATNAELNYPEGVAVDATGNLFIADYYNNRIRKVVIQGPTLVLNDVGFGNAGAYDVVVSSPYGSVTSSVVNLTIITVSCHSFSATNNRWQNQFHISAFRSFRQQLCAASFHEPGELESGQHFHHPV